MVEVRLARRGKAGFVNELVDLCIGGGVAVLSGEGFDDFGDGSAAATGGETEDGSEDGCQGHEEGSEDMHSQTRKRTWVGWRNGTKRRGCLCNKGRLISLSPHLFGGLILDAAGLFASSFGTSHRVEDVRCHEGVCDIRGVHQPSMSV